MGKKWNSVCKLAALGLTLSLLAGCGGGTASTPTPAPAPSAAAADSSTPSAPAPTYVFKFALQNGENHPLCQSIAKFGEILSEKTGGRITLDLHYSGSLGDKATTVQGLQTGTIDACMLTSGIIADYGCEQLKVLTLPYLFDSVEHARAFEKGPDGKALLDSIESDVSKLVCIGAYQESGRNYFFKDDKVTSPADMKGLLIRCQEGAVYYDAVEAMGAAAQSVAFSELYSALESGVVDGAEQPLSGFVNNAFQEVAKYYVMDQHEISPNLILFSQVTWNNLSAEDQQVIREAFDESVTYFEELSDSKDAEYLQTIKDAGVEIVDVDVSQWQEACAGVYDTYGAEYATTIQQIKDTKY